MDDISLTESDQAEIDNISKAMGSAFKMKSMGELKTFIGIQANRTEKEIQLSQENYTKAIVKKFLQNKCKPGATPMTKAYVPRCNETPSQQYSIREAIDSLMYLANATRPDIAYTVNNVSRYATKPTKSLWTAIQRIFKYLNSTPSLGITMIKSTFEIQGWANSNITTYATNTELGPFFRSHYLSKCCQWY